MMFVIEDLPQEAERRPPAPKGRGAAENPPNRFEELHYALEDVEPAPDEEGLERVGPRTRFFRDASRTAIARNESPDVGFEASVNPYRGCEHGCVYCYARPTHEYLGFSAGLDFESKIMVKEDLPELLRAELLSPRWEPRTIVVSGVTDAYQPVERRLRLTRRCLEVLVEFRNPVAIVTKSRLVARDADLLADLARDDAAAAFLSVTTLDRGLQRDLEPRASSPAQRLDAIRALADAGVPAGVMVAPVIPGLTDHEVPAILEAAKAAGARFAGYVVMRLPHAVKDLVADWLARHRPDRASKVLNRVRALRGGRLNDPRFGSRMEGEGIFAEQIRSLFEAGRRRAGLEERGPRLSTAAFRRPPGPQGTLFA
jgi:DNA repair photolyase